MMRPIPNTDARTAWARRHGLDPALILNDNYTPTRLDDQHWRYHLLQIALDQDGRIIKDGNGDVVGTHVEVIATSDDPLPAAHITGEYQS